jgi:hypothetical protein
VVDGANAQTKDLIEYLTAAVYEVEVTDRYERDVTEDAGVGAYIALVDGDRRERARQLGTAVRAAGFRTPLWALADSHRIADVGVLDLVGEVAGYIYLGGRRRRTGGGDRRYRLRHEPAHRSSAG